MGNYPTSLELKSQPVSKLQCYICGTNDSENCFEPQEKFISDCPDISYDCCYIRKGISNNKLNAFPEKSLKSLKDRKYHQIRVSILSVVAEGQLIKFQSTILFVPIISVIRPE